MSTSGWKRAARPSTRVCGSRPAAPAPAAASRAPSFLPRDRVISALPAKEVKTRERDWEVKEAEIK